MTDGLILLYKPAGVTSVDVVDRVRLLTGAKRAGHAGTLDPAAEGILPIAVGHGTKFLEILERSEKAYLARVTFGVVTDTFDADGQVVAGPNPVTFGLGELLEALQSFRGEIQQIPPPFSAIKTRGVSLHRLARKGIQVQPRPRTVKIHALDLLGWQPPNLYLGVECSKGTYVRSMAHDLGQALGCGAYLSYLLRLRVGPFYLDEAVDLDQVEAASRDGWLDQLILPPEEVLGSTNVAVVDRTTAHALARGLSAQFKANYPASEAVALGPEGRALAILVRRDADLWHPRKVFHSHHDIR